MSEIRRDRGMTLTELLIAVSLVGVLAAVLASSIIVTLRQHDNTGGRLNVARAEQNISMWIPADLASADTVIKDPEASPCGAPVCPDGLDLSQGSNVLMLSWQEVVHVNPSTGAETTHRTNVSYNFYPDGTGTYQLRRVECVDQGGGWQCGANVVLRDLPGPPAGQSFVPGVGTGSSCADPDNNHPQYDNPTPEDEADDVLCTVPDWVVLVSFPLTPDATSADPANQDTSEAAKNANRVIVTVTGGGDTEGAGGGVNQISITAGGTVRTLLDPESSGVPEFVEARSRCGGPLTLVLDQSGSIANAGAGSHVRDAARAFVETLVGTPVALQVIGFSYTAHVIGAGSDQHRYFDMTDTGAGGDVELLLDLIDDPMTFSGATNWEDALFRTFFTADGLTPLVRPETVVFFTDGAPTADRTTDRTDTASLTPPELYDPDVWDSDTNNVYAQASYNRAEYIAKSFRVESGGSIRLIGVGVGGINDYVTWVSDPGNPYQSRVDFERKPVGHPNSSYVDIPPQTYYDRQSGDGYQYRLNGRRSWYGVTESEYDQKSTLSSTYRDTSGSNRYWQYSTDDAIGRQTASVRGRTVLSRLITGNDNGTLYNGSNAEIADMYVLSSSQWDELPNALRTVALGECGGTLTLSTRMPDGTFAADPFTYQKNKVFSPGAGSPETPGPEVPATPSQVETNLQFTTRTFDFTIDGGSYSTVEIVPQVGTDMDAYGYVGWTCRAGLDSKPVHTFPTVGGWHGMRVDIRPNEAVACEMRVD